MKNTGWVWKPKEKNEEIVFSLGELVISFVYGFLLCLFMLY